MRPTHALLLALLAGAPALWAAGVISVDPGEPAYQRPERGKHRGGDIQVGPAVRNKPAAASKKKPLSRAGSRVPGIFPVFETGRRWMLLERVEKGGTRMLRKGSRLVVIGSRGVEEFYAARSTMTYLAGCEGFHPKKSLAYYLRGRKAKHFKKVGTPVIAILLRGGKSFDSKRALFYPLRNEVKESVYQRFEAGIRNSVIEDIKSGAFAIAIEDEKGHAFAQKPDPQGFLVKIDFASKIRLRGFKKAFMLVEGAQVSKSYRRCMRLFEEDSPVGKCAEMPDQLMTETRNLNFVAYDPAGRGVPFVLAYTKKAPLWGHERWGFQLTDSGPKVFLQDALDPRCRESF
ncbi:hypothetical protein ACFL2T_07235 [Elusimicrobiota bacterium]